VGVENAGWENTGTITSKRKTVGQHVARVLIFGHVCFSSVTNMHLFELKFCVGIYHRQKQMYLTVQQRAKIKAATVFIAITSTLYSFRRIRTSLTK